MNVWYRAVDRLARYGWRVLLASVVVALVGGVIQVFVSEPGVGPSSDFCPRPPCGPEGLPSLSDAATVLPILGYLLVIVLGVPSLLFGTWDLVRGRGTEGGRRLLAFVGPVVILVGTETVPHIVNLGLCAVAADLCTFSSEVGTDIRDRWHPLDHAVFGAVPMTAIYWLARRR